MENMQKACHFYNGFSFRFFSQGFYFSVGYFAFTKTAYMTNFLKNLRAGRMNIECLS